MRAMATVVRLAQATTRPTQTGRGSAAGAPASPSACVAVAAAGDAGVRRWRSASATRPATSRADTTWTVTSAARLAPTMLFTSVIRALSAATTPMHQG